MNDGLPIDAVLPDLLTALRDGTRALLIAPPGAGKTTRVAPALLDQAWCSGEVLLLVPRRLAARAAAEFIARERGEGPGATIGYATRLDSKVGKETRVVVMTYGVFLARLQSDPELSGVSGVLFDEVHERSLDSDLALALALDAATAFRPDLRIAAMSATLDGAAFARLLGDPPRIESEGQSYPLHLRHIGRDAGQRIEPEVAAACRAAMADHPGSLLAFLPGMAEIERTAQALGPLPADVVLHRLHGQVDPAAQRAAIAAPAPGTRKLVLASSIAETSLTIDGVRIVVDSGLSRRPHYDRAAGLTRLVTERASRAAITQRAGRVARQGEGVAIRLWEEAGNAALPEQDSPEILEADLSSLLLTCLCWGESDPARLPFLDKPPVTALAEARRRLTALGALDETGMLTAHGRAIAALPLEPRLAHMLIEAGQRGISEVASEVALLLTERGLGGNDPDLELRLRRWRSDRGPRADAARRMSKRFQRLLATTPSPSAEQDGLASAIAIAFPDRLARRRDASGEQWVSVAGRGFRLDPTSPLGRSEWLAVAEVAGSAAGARIVAAAAIGDDAVQSLFGSRIEAWSELRFDPATSAVSARKGRRLGAIQLSAAPDPAPSGDAVEAELVDAVRRHGLALLPWPASAVALRARAAFAAAHAADIPDLSDASLVQRVDEWLRPLVQGRRSLGAVDPSGLRSALDGLLGWEAARAIDRLAPAEFHAPSASSYAIDYATPGGPSVELRVQALFGLRDHPAVAGGHVPLILSLTSPAHRPIQTTRDLPAFWSGSWREVAKEMRGRYPKHAWPDDPASAVATLRTKRASS